jgi:hypothetical protein
MTSTVQTATDADLGCPTCHKFDNVVFVGAVDAEPGQRWAWLCTGDLTDWTTAPRANMPCPDGLPWCRRHYRDPDGDIHATEWMAAVVDRDGRPGRDRDLLSVNGSVSTAPDGPADGVVWVSSVRNSSCPDLAEGVGFSPAGARNLAAVLIKIANQIEGVQA